MDREDRQAVKGTWTMRPAPAGDHHVHQKDPHGWRTHHAGYTRPHTAAAKPEELVEAIRARAFELFVERQRIGAQGSPERDWLLAEREVLARNAHPSCGSAHPAVP